MCFARRLGDWYCVADSIRFFVVTMASAMKAMEDVLALDVMMWTELLEERLVMSNNETCKYNKTGVDGRAR